MGRKGLVVLAGVLAIAVCLLAAAMGSLLLLRGSMLPWNAAAVKPAAQDAASSAPTAEPGAPGVGMAAPDFTLPRIDQQTVSLSQFRGKPVILNFWATWCGPCNAEMPNLEKVYQQHKDDVTILSVDQGDTADQVKGFSEIYRLNFPLLLDQKMQLGDRYRVRALPTTVFIDKQGMIREVHIGGPMSVDFLQTRIQTLLGQ